MKVLGECGVSDTSGLPIDLLSGTIRALLESSVTPCVIGSLSLLEHLPPHLWRFLKTDDVDYLLALDSEAQAVLVGHAMGKLGLRRHPHRLGKWVSTTATVDLIGRTMPEGFAEPTCLPEPFANVMYLERITCRVIPQFIDHPRSARVVAAGPLVTALGKSLKVARYLRLADWSTDSNRRARAARSARDTVLLIVHNSELFDANCSEALSLSATNSGREVFDTLKRGMLAFVDLFGQESSRGWILARGTGCDLGATAKDVSQIVEECASGLKRVGGRSGR